MFCNGTLPLLIGMEIIFKFFPKNLVPRWHTYMNTVDASGSTLKYLWIGFRHTEYVAFKLFINSYSASGIL